MMASANGNFSDEIKALFAQWIEHKDNAEKSKEISEQLYPLLEKSKEPLAKELLSLRQYFVKKSIWIIGGDGWAYDIGYGGLDHVIASGEDLIFLFWILKFIQTQEDRLKIDTRGSSGLVCCNRYENA
jgi:pyruvate-ferredoxin/flavodoxin oxidoreductase